MYCGSDDAGHTELSVGCRRAWPSSAQIERSLEWASSQRRSGCRSLSWVGAGRPTAVRPEVKLRLLRPPTRATFRDPYVRGYRDHPSEGQVIKVFYRPRCHEVKLNPEDWKYSSGKSKDEKQAADERFETAEHGSPRLLRPWQRLGRRPADRTRRAARTR